MKGIEYDIHFLLLMYEDLGWGEIMSCFDKKKHRTVGRAINRLVKNHDIEYGKIRGKGKWERYFVKEEKTKNNLLHEVVDWKDKNNWKKLRVPVTQRYLSRCISEEIQFYRKEELREWNKVKKRKVPMVSYVFYHVAVIIMCLRWISQLTWAIRSGMLGNSKTKLALAYRNKERYEEFLQTLVYNLNERDEKIMKTVAKAIYHQTMDSLDFQTITMGTPKGKFVFQFDKKTKFKTKL